MGDFVVRVHAVGGHGCQREKKHGEKLVWPCGAQHCATCPDNIAHEFVEKLRANGCSIHVASLTHWPADTPSYASQPLGEVRDDLVGGTRRGSF
jgi:hypothetical protein